MIKTYRFFPLLFLYFLTFYGPLIAQDPVQSIRDLKEGILVIRFPGYKSKIDTLTSMISRTEGKSKARLEKMLEETKYERDSVRQDYINAFRTYYDFSMAVHFMDYESRDLSKAHFYSMEGSPVPFQKISGQPHLFLVFEKTQESKIDALVVYDHDMKKLPPPFPNNFSLGGFNFLFVSLLEKKVPDWIVKRINKKFQRFWETVN